MSWTQPRVMDSIAERDRIALLREIHTRFRCFGSFTWDAPNVPAASTVDTTLTSATVPVLAGLRVGMPVQVTPPSGIAAGLLGWAWVATDDTLTIRLVNVTGLDINEASGTWAFMGVIL